MPRLSTQASPSAERTWCSEYSRAAGEELPGTARTVDLWLLIEYRERWAPEAIAVFPPAVQIQLSSLRSRFPKMRLALIKQPERAHGLLTAFCAFSRQSEPGLYEIRFTDYEHLTSILSQLEPGTSPGQRSEGIFAVCTHGTHDVCCARFGNVVYSAMRATGENVWQISHIGGCRFAPNVVSFPEGMVYGRVEPEDCQAIVSAHKHGCLLLPKSRGRSCYSKPVQAADIFLRTQQNLTAFDDLTVTESLETSPGHWCTTFLRKDLTQHRVSIVAQSSGLSTYKSCSAIQLSPRDTFRAVESTLEPQEPRT